MTSNNDLVLDLEENGFDSLAHAVEHYLDKSRPFDWKYSVLHTFHAAELLMKARLAAIDPNLIYTKPNKPITEDSPTLKFDDLVKALQHSGVVLARQDVDDLHALRKVRNRIEHRRVSVDSSDLELWLGQAMRFLDQFVTNELKKNLRDVLDAKTHDTLIELLHGFDEAYRRPEREMGEHVGPDWEMVEWVESIECPNCGMYMVAYPDDCFEGEHAECFAPGCRAMVHTRPCERCGQGVSSVGDFDNDEAAICGDCIRYWMSKD